MGDSLLDAVRAGTAQVNSERERRRGLLRHRSKQDPETAADIQFGTEKGAELVPEGGRFRRAAGAFGKAVREGEESFTPITDKYTKGL